jgi:hypothetical protein
MTPGLVQRHHDYVLGPNQDGRLAAVTAGQLVEGLVLRLDMDAPFLLRSRAVRIQSDVEGGQAAIESILLRWAGPDRDFQSQNLIRQSLVGPYLGQVGNPMPVSPQVVYPRGGQIMVDLLNDGASTLTNVCLYFRGSKLYSPGDVKSYGYPATFGGLPYAYPQGRYSDTDGLTLVRDVAAIQGPLRQTFKVKGDADFVFRAGQAGNPFAASALTEVFAILRDEDEKPYSNDAIHIDILFGNSGAAQGFGSATIGGGPNLPGVFFPEIYVPKNHLMYMDVSRNDTAPGAATQDIPFTFLGQKVFQK